MLAATGNKIPKNWKADTNFSNLLVATENTRYKKSILYRVAFINTSKNHLNKYNNYFLNTQKLKSRYKFSKYEKIEADKKYPKIGKSIQTFHIW